MSAKGQRKRAWNALGAEASAQSVTLEKEAPQMSDAEIGEILQYLPDLDGKSVLDLGAGIGRFTVRFAQRAKLVTAVDFCRGFHEENSVRSQAFENVECYCADVVEWAYPSAKYDFVFSNWLMMYMDDADVSRFLSKIHHCLKPGGLVFLRESCRHPARGERQPVDGIRSAIQDVVNVTEYREPGFYVDAFADAGFVPVSEGNIRLYEERYGNKDQLFWILKRHLPAKVSP